MKKTLFTMLILVVAISVSAQVQNKSFDTDTVKAETLTYASNQKVKKYSNTAVIFTFSTKDIADSLSVAKLQGSNDNTNFVDLTDATASLSETTTDGAKSLYVVNPIYLYYRGSLTAPAGDTVEISNARFVIKED